MVNKTNGSSIETEWARAPPKVESFWEKCGRAVYNPEDNSCFGRTPKRWGIVLIFYTIFYAVLAALFSICMAGLYQVLETDKPKFTLESSLIGANPGVTYRPLPTDGGFTMKYSVDSQNHTDYVQQLDDFFKAYENESWYGSQKECVAADSYGFPETPCFFIKVNKIYGWKPSFLDGSSLPQAMSDDLRQHIADLKPSEQKQIWVSCFDEHGNDTKFEYPWGYGLPSRYFPYLNTKDYHSPLVAVRVTPKVGTLTTIRCRAWADNIIYNRSIKEGTGYARIQLQIDNSTTNA